MRSLLSVICAVVFLFGSATTSRADIVLDYTHDISGVGFFTSNATAKSALEAAVSDINQVLKLSNSLSSISEAQNDVTGTNGGTTATAQYRLTYTNPQTGASETWDPFSLGTDEIKIFVGMRNLTGTTLGQGGPGGFGFSISGGGSPSEWVGAVADMESQSNTILGRGHGPTISTLSGSLTLGGTTANYDISKGATHGNLWFDSDTNNDGSFDSNAELEANWHFDHTTAVAAGKSDFYSVALHEVLHAIGVGTSETWDSFISGAEGDANDDDWTGVHAIAANGGSGVDLIDDGHGHISSGTMSTSIVDGSAQEAVMTPSITVGTRKHLTDLDIAFLRDIGYTNASASAVPEPGSIAMVSLLSLAGFVFLRRRRTSAEETSLAA